MSSRRERSTVTPFPPPPPPSSQPLVPSRPATANHDAQHSPSVNLSRSSSTRSARLSSSLFPTLRLALGTGSPSGSSASPLSPSSTRSDMRPSRSRDPPPKPRSILTLKLSGPSFLDAVIKDDRTKEPIYILETEREVTTIHRLNHATNEPIKAATVQWPLHPVRVKGKSGRTVQMGNGSWREAEELLKLGPLGSSMVRKFNLPRYPHSLKWKLVPGNCYCCVTQTLKTPLAALDAATLDAPPRLKIYNTLIDPDTARSQENFRGIPVVLMDYLVVTSLLLVTDVQEWLDRPSHESSRSRMPGSSNRTIQRWLALIHNEPLPTEPSSSRPPAIGVDLNVTVPVSSPPSATQPSPGGMWETQSGVTSLSGSGSGSSTGEPFTPITPSTPASAHSFYLSRTPDDIPPVPPVPDSSQLRSLRPSSSPFPSQAPSTNSKQSRAMSHPFALADSNDLGEGSSRPRLQATNPDERDPSASTPALVSSLSSKPSTSRRQLPVPPGSSPASPPTYNYAQPWLYPSSTGASSSTSALPLPPPPPSPLPAGSTSPTASALRQSMRGTLRTSVLPPPPPPPTRQVPLPPKLQEEADTANRRQSMGQQDTEHGEGPSGVHYDSPNQDLEVGMHSLSLSVGAGQGQPADGLAPAYANHANLPPVPSPSLLPAQGPAINAREPGVGPRFVDVEAVQLRQAYSESVYELPPPAYDAIDFSVQYVPLVTPLQRPAQGQ